MRKERLFRWVLHRGGLVPIAKEAVSAAEQVRWVLRGFPNPCPQTIKRRIIKDYLSDYRIDCFIETGTYTGDTLARIAKRASRCTSIELSTEYAMRAKRRFAKAKNVEILEGDSGTLIPQVLNTLTEPTLFWLDGHYSGGMTAGVEKHTPIDEELCSILGHHIKGHVILIDDARCFNGANGYPKLEDLLSKIRRDGHYSFEVSLDIIRLTPKKSEQQ